jgi:hypothetical protein
MVHQELSERFAFEKTPNYKTVSELQIRPNTWIDGKLRSLSRLLEAWHGFAWQELAQNLDRAGRLQPKKRPVGCQFQFRASERRDDDFDFVHRNQSCRVILVIGQSKFFVRFTVGRQPFA